MRNVDSTTSFAKHILRVNFLQLCAATYEETSFALAACQKPGGPYGALPWGFFDQPLPVTLGLPTYTGTSIFLLCNST